MTKHRVPLLRTISHRAQRFLDVRRSGHREKVRAYQGCHQGRRAFVIGNGPSVRLEDLERLKNEVTFCCNRFHLAYPRITFRPDYTVVADARMLQHFGNEIAEGCRGDLIVGSAYMPRHLDTDFTWVRLKQRTPFKCSPDVHHHIAPGGSVVVVALQMAFYMGIREVYLYGIDHEFSFHRIPGDSGLVSGDGNHFLPDYRAGQAWYPPEISEIEEALASCRKFYEAHGGQILNATRGGQLSQMERASFDQIDSGNLGTTPGVAGSENPARPEPR